jgi:hypothetical protein
MSRPKAFKANFRGSVVGGNELKSGLLQKKSTGAVKRWQKRYFVVSKSGYPRHNLTDANGCFLDRRSLSQVLSQRPRMPRGGSRGY